MPTSQQDYILRLIEQIGAALRRMRDLLARSAPPGEVVREARDAQADLFGPMWPALSAVDPATAASLVRDPRQLGLWADLLRVEAEAHRRLSDDARAAALEVRAEALSREAGERPGR